MQKKKNCEICSICINYFLFFFFSENNGGSIRINLYPTPNYQRMLTASCAKITKGNNLAKNGIVHVVDGVVVPAIQSIQEIIDESRQLTSLKRSEFVLLNQKGFN